MDDVGQAGDVGLALLDNGEGEDGQVHAGDAAADRLALALAGAAGAVARVASGEQEADTVGGHDTLLHGETLLVVAAGDLEDVALELVAERVAGNLNAHLKMSSLVFRVREGGKDGQEVLVKPNASSSLVNDHHDVSWENRICKDDRERESRGGMGERKHS